MSCGDQPSRIFGQGTLPGGIVCGQILQQSLVRLEHIVQKPRREKVFDRVPVDYKFSGGFLNHVIKAHLRGLAHGVNRLPQAARPSRLSARASEVQEACEYHRHDRFQAHALKSCQFADHLNAAEIAVIEVLPQLFLGAASARLEAFRLRVVHFQEIHGSEIPDDVVRLLVQGQSIEQGEINREMRALAPNGEHFRIRGKQNTGGSQPGSRRLFFHGLPGRPIQASLAPVEERF